MTQTTGTRPTGAQSQIDLDKFRQVPLGRAPFDHVVVPGFLNGAAAKAINDDFPEIPQPGSFPAADVSCGAAFERLLEELRGPEVEAAFEEKFSVQLRRCPITITVRGRAQDRDGRIHTDSDSKLITVLIYMNPAWESDAGRLRLLNGPDNLDDYAVEVPPEEGTLIAFRNGPTAFHGHKPLVGERRSIQLNWVSGPFFVWRERVRHGLSARLKSLLGGA